MALWLRWPGVGLLVRWNLICQDGPLTPSLHTGIGPWESSPGPEPQDWAMGLGTALSHLHILGLGLGGPGIALSCPPTLELGPGTTLPLPCVGLGQHTVPGTPYDWEFGSRGAMQLLLRCQISRPMKWPMSQGLNTRSGIKNLLADNLSRELSNMKSM